MTLHYAQAFDALKPFEQYPPALWVEYKQDRQSGGTVEKQISDELSGGPITRLKTRPISIYKLHGRTNGFVRWLKNYEGLYRSLPYQDGVSYEVDAIDQGFTEFRSIVFPHDIFNEGKPEVLHFRDRTAVAPLETERSVDRRSMDPVNLLRNLLRDIEANNGCPLKPKTYRIFDGKRRYLAELSGSKFSQSWRGRQAPVVEIVSKQSAFTSQFPEVEFRLGRDLSESQHGIIEQKKNRNLFASQRAEEGLIEEARVVGDGEAQYKPQDEALQSVADNGDELYQTKAEPYAKKDDVSKLVLCTVLLTARTSETNSERGLVAKNSGKGPAEKSHASDSSVKLSTSQKDSLTRRPGVEVSRKLSDPIKSQRRLFWPFNQRELTIQFEVDLEGDFPRFYSFRIDAPFGRIKGISIPKDS